MQRLSADIHSFVVIPFYHSGAVLTSVVGFALVIASLSHRVSAGWLFVWIGTSVFSDPLVVPWLAVPAVLVAALMRWRGNSTSHATMIACTAGVIVGLSAERFTHGFAYIGSKRLPEAIASVGPLVANVLRSNDVAAMMVGAIAFILILRGCLLGQRLIRGGTWRSENTFELLLAASAGACAAAPVLAGGNMAGRYFSILWLIGVLWLALQASHVAQRWLCEQWAMVIVPTILLSVVIGASGVAATQNLVAKPPLQRCLEQAELRDGLGDYWSAKALIYRSERSIHLA
jgi:hypothetical protein